MIICKWCNFKPCDKAQKGETCVPCHEDHERAHDEWALKQYYQGFTADSIPGAEWIDTKSSNTYTGVFGFFSFLSGEKKEKLCVWCEEKVNLDLHQCPKIKESVDCNYFINKLKDTE